MFIFVRTGSRKNKINYPGANIENSKIFITTVTSKIESKLKVIVKMGVKI